MNWERELGVQVSLEERARILRVLTEEKKARVEIVNGALRGERTQRK